MAAVVAGTVRGCRLGVFCADFRSRPLESCTQCVLSHKKLSKNSQLQFKIDVYTVYRLKHIERWEIINERKLYNKNMVLLLHDKSISIHLEHGSVLCKEIQYPRSHCVL